VPMLMTVGRIDDPRDLDQPHLVECGMIAD
jgi:hypothetical protein